MVLELQWSASDNLVENPEIDEEKDNHCGKVLSAILVKKRGENKVKAIFGIFTNNVKQKVHAAAFRRIKNPETKNKEWAIFDPGFLYPIFIV